VKGKKETEAALPATAIFVSIVGGLIALGWIAMFVLLRSRW
jgi:hypothetical protein